MVSFAIPGGAAEPKRLFCFSSNQTGAMWLAELRQAAQRSAPARVQHFEILRQEGRECFEIPAIPHVQRL